MVIAIDGPGGVGKSTVSRRVANLLQLDYLDTGSTYRAATVLVLEAAVDPGDEDAILELLGRHTIDYGSDGVMIDGASAARAVRDEEVTANVSQVSAHPRVRRAIVDIQRAWVHRHDGAAVVEGRDIGTVVFPDAPVKVFLTASPEVRAKRRANDDQVAESSVEKIASSLAARDAADSTRAASPLTPATDATILDTGPIGIDEVVDAVVALTQKKQLHAEE